MKKIITCSVLLALLAGCQTIRQSSKYGFTEGYYKGHVPGKQTIPIYVIDDDTVKVYPTLHITGKPVDTTRALLIQFPSNHKPAGYPEYVFRQNTFDIDILSILLKYRPSVHGFPNQLNTSILNGALFFGYRTDSYHLRYLKTPFQTYRRDISHYGFSFGLFTGIGASRIDEFVTQNAVNIQYDGLVNPSGIAAIVALNKLTFGLTFGIDHLLDKNNRHWIYQGKPWLGLSVGLNLN